MNNSLLDSLKECYYVGVNNGKETRSASLLVDVFTRQWNWAIDSQHIVGTNKTVAKNNGIQNRTFNVRFYFFNDMPSEDMVNKFIVDRLKDSKSLTDMKVQSCFDKAVAFRDIIETHRYGRLYSSVYNKESHQVTPTNLKEIINLQNDIEMTAIDITFMRYEKIKTVKSKKSTKEETDASSDTLVEKTIISLFPRYSETEKFLVESDFGSNQIEGSVIKQKSILQNNLSSFSNVMGNIIKASNDIENSVYNFEKKINDVLDVFITDPLFAIKAVQDILKMPALVATNISNKVDGYLSFIETLFENDVATYSEKSFNDLFLKTTAATISLATTVGEYRDRNEALYVGQKLNEAHEKINIGIAKLEGNVVGNITEEYKMGILYSSDVDTTNIMADMFTKYLNYLEENIYNLPLQSNIVLDRDRNFIELCYEIYHSVDVPILNKFLIDNKLEGQEYYIIPKGRNIVYYKEAI